MRPMSMAMKDHIAGDVTTLCTCWRATLRNGTIIGFTDHTRNITFGGQLYKASSGYTPTSIESSCMLNVDNLEVEGIINGVDVTEGDLLAGLWDEAKVLIFWLNWNDLTMGAAHMKSGTVGQIVIKDTSFVAEVRGLTQAYATVIGDLTSSLCRARFGDARCGVDLAAYTFTASVDSVDGNRVISSASLTQPGPTGGIAITGISRAKRAVVTTSEPHPFESGSNVLVTGVVGVVQEGAEDSGGEFMTGSNGSVNNYTYGIADVTSTSFSIPLDTRLANDDATLGPEPALQYSDYVSGGLATPQGDTGYFTSGLVTFTSGLNDGLSMEIKGYFTGLVELQLPMPYPIAEGDSYTIQRGCNKRFVEDCIEIYSNPLNFRGEPHLPGIDQAIQVGGPAESPT